MQKPGNSRHYLEIVQSNRLPRLRRCKCCRRHRHRDFKHYRYRVVNGVVIFCEPLPLQNALEVFRIVRGRRSGQSIELERIHMIGETGMDFELIRNGKWVDWWQAQYGRHKDEVP